MINEMSDICCTKIPNEESIRITEICEKQSLHKHEVCHTFIQ